MRESVQLGHVAGIRLAAHWSLLVVVAIVALGLDHGILPSVAPGMSGGWYLAAALATSLAFVVTIVAHELGHAVVAGRQGLPVESVVVWALGGITSIGGEPSSPAAELALSGVGPAVSLVLGALLVGLGLAVRWLGGPALLAGSLAWLGGLNVLLALLNALPASPLDGGRMFHALLWRVTRDRARATGATTRVGQAVGFGAAAAGVYLMVTAGSAEGLWIVVTGLFVGVGASAERRQAATLGAIGDRQVWSLMTPLAPAPVPGWWSVDQVLAHGGMGLGGPVGLAGPAGLAGPVGVVTDWHGRATGLVALEQLAAVPPATRSSVRVGDVAVPAASVVASSPDELVVELLRRWPTEASWGVAVAGGRAVGVIDVAVLNALLAGQGRRVPWARTRPGNEPAGSSVAA